MAELRAREEMLETIEESIQATERHICRLNMEFASLLFNGATAERLVILQQLYILQVNLTHLKVRRMYLI